MKYRKRPIVIEAVQWTGGPDQTEDPVWLIDAFRDGTVQVQNDPKYGVYLTIDTEEGRMNCSQYDWIIKGIKGELYPCKPDIFKATYENVEE